jgi:hypothetical protein
MGRNKKNEQTFINNIRRANSQQLLQRIREIDLIESWFCTSHWQIRE